MNIYSLLDLIDRRYLKMPNRDRTGPEGKGPVTGRGLGDCRSRDQKRPLKKGLGPCGDGTPNYGRGFGKRGR